MENIPFTSDGLFANYYYTKNLRCCEAYLIVESFLRHESEFFELFTDVYDNSGARSILRQDASFELQMYFSNLGFKILDHMKQLESYRDVFNPIRVYQSCADIKDVLRDLKCEEV